MVLSHNGWPHFTITTDRASISIMGIGLGCWAGIIYWSASPYSVFLGHGELGEVTTMAGLLPLVSLFLLGWSLMVFAMMLPTTLPLVKEIRRQTSELQLGRRSLVLMVLGCVGVWVPFGVMVYVFDIGVHGAAELPLFQSNVWVFGLSSLALAGAYQFTRKKSGFMQDCCYPSEFLQSRRQDLIEGKALRIGLGYGKASLGSHWALMLLMFSLGLGSIFWMLALGLVMALEHERRLGPMTRVPMGVAILLTALALGLGRLPA